LRAQAFVFKQRIFRFVHWGIGRKRPAMGTRMGDVLSCVVSRWQTKHDEVARKMKVPSFIL
jgi:hypothetical protein